MSKYFIMLLGDEIFFNLFFLSYRYLKWFTKARHVIDDTFCNYVPVTVTHLNQDAKKSLP